SEPEPDYRYRESEPATTYHEPEPDYTQKPEGVPDYVEPEPVREPEPVYHEPEPVYVPEPEPVREPEPVIDNAPSFDDDLSKGRN
ncbi:MAG: hypothetical protein IJP42_07305, partial [Selenomonadaceae bacterium]|nr:hypothetical protein [Selenomonadaceae bacterium]